MTSTIDTLGKAVRHSMILRVTCRCGRRRDFRCDDLMMRYGGGRDPSSLRFRCACGRPHLRGILIEKKPPQKTIAEAIEEGNLIAVHCNRIGCHAYADLNLPMLSFMLGPNHGVMHDDLIRLFACPKCGNFKDLSLNSRPDYDRLDAERLRRPDKRP